MKTSPRKKKITAVILSLALCCSLVLGGPAASAQETPAPQEPTLDQQVQELLLQEEPPLSDSQQEPQVLTEADGTQEEEQVDPNTGEGTGTEEGSGTEEGQEDPQTPEDGPQEETPEEDEDGIFTVTYSMGSHGSVTEEVADGELPQQVPDIPALPGATALGWFDQDGQQVSPAEIPVTGDVTYTARWTRNMEELLKMDYHEVYITGYENGMFYPSNSVTRAQAATMFYKLLQNKEWEQRTFSDVPATAWYADAVNTLAGLGILSGYTDGTFRPGHEITRAEFVTIVMAFSQPLNEPSGFLDVPETHWASDSIAAAVKNGWISGYTDGTFHPEDSISRAEAVSIINKMLGRTADPDYVNAKDVKNFYDMFPSHWAYAAIVEASTAHIHEPDATPEKWKSYVPDTAPVTGHWIQDGSRRYYVDPSTKKLATGQLTIGGTKYLFGSDHQLYTGFSMDGQWRRYYKNGVQQTDISELGVVSGPYYIKVYKPANFLIIYAKDPSTGKYNTPVRAMRVSCGYGTPTGTYYTPARYRWLKMVGNTWAQWCTQIQGNYLFHSVPNWTKSNKDLEVGEYNHLGDTRSLGCIRLNCEDAKWIYDNCQLGTQVYISATETTGPLSKPAGLQIPSWHTWDPTDPTAYVYCDQHGCHQNLH
ncbi:MAG: S-layer homology domain-containing protein [Acutalibacter sp.]|jgi:hypothetical protein